MQQLLQEAVVKQDELPKTVSWMGAREAISLSPEDCVRRPVLSDSRPI
jgi:hypothetical protein